MQRALRDGCWLGILLSGVLLNSTAAAAKTGRPRTVVDYYMLLPDHYVEGDRRSLLNPRHGAIVDTRNGYMRTWSDGAQPRLEVCIFKRPDASYLTAVSCNYQGDPFWQPSLDFYAYRNGRLMDVTQATMPRRFNKSLGYKLPRYGTTIGVITESGRRVYDLFWAKGTFHVKPTSQKRGEASARSLSGWPVSGDGVGPFRLGLSEAAVFQAARRSRLRITKKRIVSEVRESLDPQSPYQAWSELSISHEGKRLLLITVGKPHHIPRHEEVTSIEITDPRIRTADGAHVGMRFQALARLYGRGYIQQEGALSVYFGEENLQLFAFDFFLEAPEGLKFTSDTPNGAVVADEAWQRLLKANPRVTAIIIGGC